MMEEKTIKTKGIYEGKIINLRVDTIKLPDGREATREIIEHPGGVAVLPVDADGNVYLVRQYRKPIEHALLEAPAGKLCKGEEHLSCGIMELKEETGLTAGSITYLGFVFPSPGYSNEVIHLYLARQLSHGQQNTDSDEFVDIEVYHIDDVIKMCQSGEITDAKTVAAVFRAKAVI
jgi:ADP-ribose pyrophosphatase